MRNTFRKNKTETTKFDVKYPKSNQSKNNFTTRIKKIEEFNPIITRKTTNEIREEKINDRIMRTKISEITTTMTKVKKYQKITKINAEKKETDIRSNPQSYRENKKIKQKEINQTTQNNYNNNTVRIRNKKIENNRYNKYKTLKTFENVRNLNPANANCLMSKLVISNNRSNYFHKKPLLEKYSQIDSTKKESNNIFDKENIYSKPLFTSENRENKFRCNSQNSKSIPNHSFRYLVHEASQNKELSNSFNKYYEKRLQNKLSDNYLTNITTQKSQDKDSLFSKEERDLLKKLRNNSNRKYQMLNQAKYDFNTVNNSNHCLEELNIYNPNTYNGFNNTFNSGYSNLRNNSNSNNYYNTNTNTIQNNETIKRKSINTINSQSSINYEKRIVRPLFNSPDFNDNDNDNYSPNKNLYNTFVEFENVDRLNLSKNENDLNVQNVNLENLLIIENFYNKINDKLVNEQKCLKEIYDLINFNLAKKFYEEEINIFQQKQNIRTVIYYVKTEILCQFVLYDICSTKNFDQSLIILKNIFNELHKNFIILVSLIIRKYKTSGGDMFNKLKNIVKNYNFEKMNNEITEITESKLLDIMFDSLKNIYTCYKMLIENLYKKFYYEEDSNNKTIKFPYCLKNKNTNRKETIIIKSHFFMDAYENINYFEFTDLKNFFYLYLFSSSIRNNFNNNNTIINDSYNLYNNTSINFNNYSNIENENNILKNSLSSTLSSMNFRTYRNNINNETYNYDIYSKENENINDISSNLRKSSPSPIKYIPINRFKIKNIQLNTPTTPNMKSNMPISCSLISPIYPKNNEELQNSVYKDEKSILNKIEKIINNNPNISLRLPPIKDYYEYSLVFDLDSTLVYLYKDVKYENNNFVEKKTLILRPGLIEFLHDMKSIYELILFSSGVESYVDPLVNIIEKNEKFFEYILYKKHITKDSYGNYVKNIGLLGRNMRKILIIDDLPQYLKLNKKNSICIRPFYGDTVKDRNTLKILGNVLKKIRFDADDSKDITDSLRIFKKDLYPDVIEEIDD